MSEKITSTLTSVKTIKFIGRLPNLDPDATYETYDIQYFCYYGKYKNT